MNAKKVFRDLLAERFARLVANGICVAMDGWQLPTKYSVGLSITRVDPATKVIWLSLRIDQVSIERSITRNYDPRGAPSELVEAAIDLVKRWAVGFPAKSIPLDDTEESFNKRINERLADVKYTVKS